MGLCVCIVCVLDCVFKQESVCASTGWASSSANNQSAYKMHHGWLTSALCRVVKCIPLICTTIAHLSRSTTTRNVWVSCFFSV